MSDAIAMQNDLRVCACPTLTQDASQHPACTPERLLGENSLLLFVKPKKQWQIPCPELIYFGSGHICRCPQRIAFYKKYGH